MSLTRAELKRGARVLFIGTVHPRVQFGTEGLVTGQNRDQWYVDFPVGAPDHIETVKLWRSEMEVLG